jgi:hypothetical protein
MRYGGNRDGTIEAVTYFDPTTSHPVLSALPTVDVPISYFRGRLAGNPVASLVSKQVNYDGTRGTDGSFVFALQALANATGLEWGVQMSPGMAGGASFLTGDSSGFEGGIANWVALSNSTIAQTAAQAHSGTKSLQLTSVAGGAMSAGSCAAGSILTQGMPVVVGGGILVQGWCRTAVSARADSVGVDVYDSSGVVVGGSLLGSTVNDASGAWTYVNSGTLTVPATGAEVRTKVQVAATGGASEVHYFDDVLMTHFPAVDNGTNGGAGFTNGAQAFLHVSAYTGTDCTIKLQHSSDLASWSDISGGGFTALSAAPFSQRIVMAGSINRYVRAIATTVAGFSVLNFGCHYSPNPVPVVF